MKLNLIGNGFDLYHGLPCSYYYFGCYLAEHYQDFYLEMSKMFFVKCMRYVGYNDAEIIVDDLFWRTFEEKLGELDTTWLEESLQDDLGLEYPDDPVELEIPEVVNSQIIVEKFKEWIVNTVNTKDNIKIVNRMINGERLSFSDEEYFVNFNYTQILEQIYKIDSRKIFHIHGECDIDLEAEFTEDLIVGHGNSDEIERLENQINKIESSNYYLSSQKVKNRLTEYEAELHILKDLRKNVSELKSKMLSRLNRDNVCPDEILVWGLSCGEVDLPYMEALRDSFPDARWKFSYFNQKEKVERMKLASELGIENVDFFEFCNASAGKINRELVDHNEITEYDCV